MDKQEGKLLRIVVNGRNADDAALGQAVEEAVRQGHRVELRVTRDPYDDVRFAAAEPWNTPGPAHTKFLFR